MTTYKIGGSLPANAPTYVVRQADRDLQAYLQAGEFCYILTSRQMGKSSLKLRTIQRLVAEGVACVDIDLTGVGSAGIGAAQWYYSIADELATEFELEPELATFWHTHPHLSDVKRLGKFIDEIVLDRISGRIIIFVDEIDKVLSLGTFTDDFFGLIRKYAELQANSAKYQRLSFVLLGVAAPTDLIKDKQRTPFNIGRSIELNGFNKLTDDLSPLIQGLTDVSDHPNQEIEEVLNWTGGQPFLTQKLCQLVVEFPAIAISEIVSTKIVENWKDRDNPVHLRTIEARLLANREISSYLLQQYRNIITSESSLGANHSREQQALKLSGLIVERDGKLQVCNQIYTRVFDRGWIDRELANICPYSTALTNWLDNGRPDTLLLRGDALDEAIVWKDFQWQHNQSIGIDGAKFIDVSQATRTDRKLAKIKSRISKLIKILSILIVIGSILLFTLFWFDRSLKISDQINQLDQTSNQIVRQYEFAPIDTLKAAIVNANKSQNIQSSSSSTYTAKLALQKIVDSIQEIDEINTHQEGINAVNFCSNDRIIAAGSDGTINLWDRQKQQEEQIEIVTLKSEIKINSVRQSSSNCEDLFATGSSDGTIALWQWNINQPTKLDRPIAEKTNAHTPNDLDREGGVNNVLLTEDKRYIFSTGKTDGILTKWSIDLQNHQLTQVWSHLAHVNGVMSLNINSQKNLIGTAGKDGTAKIWDLEGNLINTLAGHIGSVNSINFKPMTFQASPLYEIATGGDDGTVRLWTSDGKYLKSINTHIGEVKTVRFSPDGKILATASAKDPTTSNGSSVRIWNLENGKLVTEFKGHQGAIDSMRFNPNFDRKDDNIRQLATSGQQDSMIRIWKIPEIMTSNKHRDNITSVRFDPDNHRYFTTAGDDGKIIWWSHQLGKIPQQQDSIDKKNKDGKAVEFKSIRIAPTSDKTSRLIAAGDTNGMISFLRIKDNKIKEIDSFNTNQAEIQSIDWRYDNKSDRYLLATTGVKGDSVRIWQLEIRDNKLVNRKLIHKQDLEYLNKKYFALSLRFSKDGNNLAVGAEKGRVALIKNVNNLPAEKPVVYKFTVNSERDDSSKVVIGFGEDDRSLTIVSKEGKIWRSNLDGKIIEGPIETYQAGTENIAISGDANIATGGAGAALKIWDLEGHQIADFKGYWGTIRSINFSKDGKYLLAGGDDMMPRVWQIDREIPKLIEQGCDWLKQGYFQSDRSNSSNDKVKTICKM